MACLYTRALSARQQAVLIAYKESDRTARILNDVEVAEAKIELTTMATSLVRELARKKATQHPQRLAPDAQIAD